MFNDTKIDISIIIVNWNAGTYLLECIQSLKATVKQYSYEIYLVDNASTDNSINRIKEEYSDLLIIENEKNVGFACGNNQAISRCRGKYIFLLNPDTALLENAVDNMITYMENNPAIAILGPRLLNSDGRSHQASTAGGFPSFKTVFNESFGLSRIFTNTSITKGLFLRDKENKILEVDWVSGASFLIRKTVIDSIGMLDEAYFLYGEDQEWCYRAKKAGHKIVFFPLSQVIHHGSKCVIKQDAGILKKNKKSFLEYLRIFNGRFESEITFRVYWCGLILRFAIAYIRVLIDRNSSNIEKLRIVEKSLEIVRK